MAQKDLATIDAELDNLEVQLERTRQKRAALERQRLLEQQQQQQTQPRQNPQPPAMQQKEMTAEELQRQIEQLQRELGMLNAESTYKAPATDVDTEEESYEEEPRPPESSYKSLSSATSSGYSSQSPPSMEPVRGGSEVAKQRHAWEKPTWALPDSAIPDVDIQKDSIVNPLLKAAKPGYERKVKEADFQLIKGKFVNHTEITPNPRLVWIVVNVDGCKLGKIVMHLYGNFLNLVDVFLELKGLEMKRQPPLGYLVDDIDPHFYIFTGGRSPNDCRGPPDACFGVVVEGHDVIQKLQVADPSSIFTIKQSHIYPVKKAK
jgi:hypothetical protein